MNTVREAPVWAMSPAAEITAYGTLVLFNEAAT